MLAIFVLVILGILALVWIVYEPISGLVGSTFIAKIMALIVAFKFIAWMMS